MEEKIIQETTSVYFNDILRKDITPISVDELPEETLLQFDAQVMKAFPEEGEAMAARVRYLVPYILQSIDWDRYSLPLEAWLLKYYYDRGRFLERSGLDYEDFLAHEPLQDSISALGLQPEPTFEFILFLKYYFGLRSELRYSAIAA